MLTVPPPPPSSNKRVEVFKAKKVTTNTQVKVFDPTPIVNKYYPIRLIYNRHVTHLWANYYRINFHSKCGEGRIVKSFFVEIDEKTSTLKNY